MTMRSDSWIGRVHAIFLHMFAVYGLLSAFYTFSSNSKWDSHVPIQSEPATLDQEPQEPPIIDRLETTTAGWVFNTTRDGHNLGLSEDQCNSAFPKQYADILHNVANLTSNPITLSDLDAQDLHDQRVRIVVYDGDVYIISRGGNFWVQNGVATVHALQRALSAFPDRKSLPNIEFSMFFFDVVGDNKAVWTYTKPAHDTEFKNQWLMPDFGFWAWPHARIPNYNHVRDEVRRVENEIGFDDKMPQLVWRGNAETAPHRPLFLEATEGKEWANATASTRISLWDHCRFKMMMDISGRSWSGKGKYIQNCQSVYVTHTPKWLTTITYPLEASGPEQNFVQVNEDWSDLEQKVTELLEDPSMADRIAKKGAEVFRDRYLTPAAEACYWRALIRGYGSVSFEPDLYEKDGTTLRGVPFESVAVSPMVELDKYWDF